MKYDHCGHSIFSTINHVEFGMVFTFLSYLCTLTKIADKDNTKAKKINHIFSQIFHFFVNLFITIIHKISNNSAITAKKIFSVIVSIIVNIANETMNNIYLYDI